VGQRNSRRRYGSKITLNAADLGLLVMGIADVRFSVIGDVIDFSPDGCFVVIPLVGVCGFYPCCGYKSTSPQNHLKIV